MDPTIAVALIATVVSPTVLGLIANRQARKSKLEDWARQDDVARRAELAAQTLAHRTEEAAAQAAQAARLLLDAQAESIARTDEVARLAATADAAVQTQLAQIHTLVNSDMTAARYEQLAAVRAHVASLRHIVDLDTTAGRTPDPDDLEAIEAGDAKITELRAILADRLTQQRAVEREQERAANAAAAADAE